MRPLRSIPLRTLLLAILIMPALAACGSTHTPGGTPTVTASVTSPPSTNPTGEPTSNPTTTAPTQTPTQTQNPGWTVVSARVAYPWHWPNLDNPVSVTHTYPAPPVAELVAIGVGNHPTNPGERPYNRMSFTFTTGYPSYRVEFVDKLVADGSGRTIPLAGSGVLRIVFNPATAHTEDGRSSILPQPPTNLGLDRMVAYARAGDFEGYLTYGIGISWPNPRPNPQIAIRVYEVTYRTGQGDYRYVVAVDVDSR